MLAHALRNALLPVTTLVVLAFAALLGGAVLTETIFSWPGVGRYVVDAALFLDYPVIMGFTLMIAVVGSGSPSRKLRPRRVRLGGRCQTGTVGARLARSLPGWHSRWDRVNRRLLRAVETMGSWRRAPSRA